MNTRTIMHINSRVVHVTSHKLLDCVLSYMYVCECDFSRVGGCTGVEVEMASDGCSSEGAGRLSVPVGR